jgi:uncharacterized protein (DUF1330 family)
MPAYVIVEVEIEDVAAYKEYKKLIPAAIAAYDGRLIVKGAKTESLKQTGTRNE